MLDGETEIKAAQTWWYEWVHAHARLQACVCQASEAKRNNECFSSVTGREDFLSLSTEKCMLMVFSAISYSAGDFPQTWTLS